MRIAAGTEYRVSQLAVEDDLEARAIAEDALWDRAEKWFALWVGSRDYDAGKIHSCVDRIEDDVYSWCRVYRGWFWMDARDLAVEILREVDRGDV